jgi:hypothetical protein
MEAYRPHGSTAPRRFVDKENHMFKATVVGTILVIEIPLESPRPSSSGKTLIVASTGGFKQTEAKVNGQLVAVSVNATIHKV